MRLLVGRRNPNAGIVNRQSMMPHRNDPSRAGHKVFYGAVLAAERRSSATQSAMMDRFFETTFRKHDIGKLRCSAGPAAIYRMATGPARLEQKGSCR